VQEKGYMEKKLSVVPRINKREEQNFFFSLSKQYECATKSVEKRHTKANIGHGTRYEYVFYEIDFTAFGWIKMLSFFAREEIDRTM
jgi:hypothetical protein